MSSAWGKAWGTSWSSAWGVVKKLLIRFIALRTIARYGMAEQFDIEIIQGDTFEWEIVVQDATGVPISLNGYTLRGMGRKSYTDVLPAFTFVCVADVNQIVNTGLMFVSLDSITTAAITKGIYKYDIELEVGGKVKKIYRGSVNVLPEATK